MYIFVLFWFNCVPGWLPASRPNSFARGKAENDNVNSFVTTRNNASFWKNRRESSQKIVIIFNIYLCCCPDAFFFIPAYQRRDGGYQWGGLLCVVTHLPFSFHIEKTDAAPEEACCWEQYPQNNFVSCKVTYKLIQEIPNTIVGAIYR